MRTVDVAIPREHNTVKRIGGIMASCSESRVKHADSCNCVTDSVQSGAHLLFNVLLLAGFLMAQAGGGLLWP
jgi:hypothetical protein